MSSSYNQVFFIENTSFSAFIISVNKPMLWAIRCIRYWNSGWRVHEIKRHCFIYTGRVYTHPSMAANLLYPPGSSLSPEVLTSFVLPAHNQGVSYAPIRGPASWTLW